MLVLPRLSLTIPFPLFLTLFGCGTSPGHLALSRAHPHTVIFPEELPYLGRARVGTGRVRDEEKRGEQSDVHTSADGYPHSSAFLGEVLGLTG
jgi:hypothetical protein